MESQRFTIWKSNLDRIEEHNKEADRHGYTLGMNQFGDLTEEEVSRHNGYQMSPLTNSNRQASFRVSDEFTPSVHVDWRDKGAVTPVQNQGECGSCWTFSATGSLEGQYYLAKNTIVPLSKQNLIDCCSVVEHSCQNGGRMDTAFQCIIANEGIDTEVSYPYEARDDTECRFDRDAVGATMNDYVYIAQGDVDALTEAIDMIGPISIAFDVTKKFYMYEGGVFSDDSCSPTKLNHAMLAVGYGTYHGKPYFLLKNSWGESWGMDGYAMVERSSRNMCGIATDAVYPVVV